MPRLLFQSAEQALRDNNSESYATLKAQLANYPLYPYLVFQELSQQLDQADATQVRAFLNAYAATPLAPKLRSAWLKQLAQQQRWSELLQDYRDNNRVELACLQRQALLNSGQREAALRDMESIWLHGRSRPDACDPLFALWRKQGGLTKELVWQRFKLALEARQAGLARYLSRQLPKPDQEQAALWLAVHNKPQRVLEAERFNALDPQTSAVLLHGLWRWSSRNSVAAAQALEILKQRYRLPDNERWQQLERRLAVFLASRGHPSAAARLASLRPDQVDDAVAEWRVRVPLRQRHWSAALQAIQRMPAALRADSTWRYWQARSLEHTDQQAMAKTIYRDIADRRDFYAFLAAERLGQPHQMGHQALIVSDAALNDLAQQPAVQRARELFLLGRSPQARIEWRHASREWTPEQLKIAAQLAHRWGWHDRAIATLARGNHWDDLHLRFPLPHRKTIQRHSETFKIDLAWAYAVMRQESLFQHDVSSSAGAMGLMQIMPGTGRKISSELNQPLQGRYALLNIDTNIRFGSYYLRAMLNRLQGNAVLATAAYNAGPSRARRWLPEQIPLPADIWIETIPFSETRKYVKRVLAYAAIYEWRLQRPQPNLQKRMARILPAS